MHSVLTVLRKKETFFKPAAAAMIAGFLAHCRIDRDTRIPIAILSHDQCLRKLFVLCSACRPGFLYRLPQVPYAIAGVFHVPMIFLMAFMANMGYDQSRFIPAELMSNWLYITRPW